MIVIIIDIVDDSFGFWQIINPLHATDLFLYPLRTSENLWFSGVYREYRNTPVAWCWLNEIIRERFLNIAYLKFENLLFKFLAQ